MNTEELFEAYLTEGEYIVWCRGMDVYTRKTSLNIVSFAGGLGFALFGASFIIKELSKENGSIAVIFGCACMVLLGMLGLYAAFEKKSSFALTNKRLISLAGKRMKDIRLKAICYIHTDFNDKKGKGSVTAWESVIDHKFISISELDNPKSFEELLREQIKAVSGIAPKENSPEIIRIR